MSYRSVIGLGVAGNFAGHLEQAGEARDFVAVKVKDAKAPKALRGALRFFNNVRRNPQARQRIVAMRKVFRANQDHLEAVALIARKPER